MREIAISTGVEAIAALRKNQVEGGGRGGRGANFHGILSISGRTQQVIAVAALRKETRSGAVGMSKPLKSVGGWVYLQAYLGDYGA